MRTLVDIPNGELDALNALSKARGVSRAELVRQAIKASVEQHAPTPPMSGFGLWKGKRHWGAWIPAEDSRGVGPRVGSRLKLPDAIILATAQVANLLLVTRNTRDFSAADPQICIPYKI